MTDTQQYFLKWNNYLRQLTCALDNHRAQDEFVDVTLLCEGRKITAHKVVLSACSTYFKDVLSHTPHPHPLLIFNFIKYEDLSSIIKFMYQGEVNVKQEGLDSFLQIAKMLSVHGLNTEGTDNDTIPSNMVSDISKHDSDFRSSSTDTNRQQKYQTTIKLAMEPQTQRNSSTATDTNTMHPTPSCSQPAHKKRKLTDTDNANDVGAADDRDEQDTIPNADDITSRDGATANLPEYILGENNDQPAAVDGLQEMNQNFDYNCPNITNIKTEYEILGESDTEEKYTPPDDAEMTIETRRLTNPSTTHVHDNLDLTASCSNATATGKEGASSELSESWLIRDKINQMHADVCKMANMVTDSNSVSSQILNHVLKLVKCTSESNVFLKNAFGVSGILNLTTKFPIKDVEDLKVMEESINMENLNEITKTVRMLLMGSIADNIEKILDPEIILSHNYDGRNGKKALKDYKRFMGIMFKALNKSAAEFEMELRTAMRKIKNKLHKRNSRCTHKDVLEF